MTLQVIAPTDTSQFKIKFDSEMEQYRVGFGYAISKTDADNGDFSDVLSGNWKSDWTSGTYVKRFEIKTSNAAIYTYGFVEYSMDDGEHFTTKYATQAGQNSAERVGYDTSTRP